ncbi:MAG: DUF362 domain-containing protein [Oscillospiraceae bacterium]|nr:DUF362 domain-containing protein [Oscillospiraceae bacterium]
MSMERVSVVRCESYDAAVCRQALLEVLEPVGGLDFIKPGMRVGIKANLVAFLKPEAAATTHPALLSALAELIRERGASAVIGDSPGGLYTAAYVKNVYRATGMYETEAAGAALNMDFGQKQADFPAGRVAKTFQYTAWLDDCDVLIDFCKLKSHGMMGLSAAAKNMFGVVPGTMKPEYHYKYPNPADFARMIVDLDEYFQPALSIVDGVIGMDGNGPTAGDPKPMGLLLASKSPHAVDLACAHLIGLEREDVPTLEAAYERGLIPARWQELDIAGDLESMVVKDFHNVRTKSDILFWNESRGPVKKLAGKFVQKCLSAVPKVTAEQCVGCGRCADICPAKAITMKNKLPHIDRRACIHCFCCQEFCPKGAMKVYRPPVARLLNR